MKRKIAALLLALCMIVSLLPAEVLASDAPNIVVDDEGCYSKVVSKRDYAISPGVAESNIVYNDASGNNQNFGYVMEIDTSNQYTDFLASYKDLGTTVKDGIYGSQVLSQQAAFAESLGYNVVGGVNTSLRWGSEEPIGMLVINGEVLHNEICENNYVVIKKDGTADIRDGTEPLDGSEQQAVACFPHWLILDGQIQVPETHSQANRAPRTAIGLKADGTLILYVCDGRNIPTTVGMTLYELAEVMQQLGCVKATNCDGGGSSTFLSEREGTGQLVMRNTPSDASERATMGGFLVVSTASPSGTFDHAAVSPSGNYYTPGSTVPVTAASVDYSGAAAGAIPEDVTWALTSENMGTIENARIEDGVAMADFVSNGTTGEVQIELMKDEQSVGSTSFSVYAPDSLAFNSDSINIGYEQVTDLGLVAKYQGNTLIMNGGDIRWTITDETIGTFDGLYLTATSDVLKSASATVTATYTGNETLTASTVVNIGMKPSVVMDGGDGNEIDPLDYEAGFGRVVARVNNPWGIGFWERGSADVNDLVTAHYTNNEANCADASVWRGGNESAEHVTTDMPEWTDIIRFGNGAVKLNYDFSQANGIEGACLGFSHDIELTGSPTGIGMWVYAPEGTANLWLRGAVGVETAAGSGVYAYTFINYTERADTAWNNSGGTDVGGINWTGWHYVEADLRAYAGRTIRVMAGETVRLMYTNGRYGPTINGIVTGMGNLSADATYIPREECKGWVLIDNLQFVYGANNEDVTEPTVSGVQWSTSQDDLNRVELENGAVLNVSKRPCFWFDYNDNEYTDRYATGVATKLFYFDGMLNGGGFSVDAEGYIFMEKYLANGPHSITCYVKDEAGNVTRETRYFTVTGANEAYQALPVLGETHSEELFLGDEFTLNVTSNYQKLSNVSNVEAVINMNRNYPVEDVVFSDDYTGSYTYEAGVLRITGRVKDGVTTATSDRLFTVKVGVPTTITSGSNFNFEIVSAYLSFKLDELTPKSVTTWSMATPVAYLPIQAKYTVKPEAVIAGHESTLRVLDLEGSGAANVEVYANDALIGATDADGVLKTTAFNDAAGRWSVYAKDADGAVSFPVIVRCAVSVGEQTPYYILSNGVADPTTQKNITWMANPDYAAASAQIRLATAESMEGAQVITGTSTPLTYVVSEAANYSNQVLLQDLQPGTTYYYQVGDGAIWSDVRSFTTAPSNSVVTNFYVIGDMQGEDAQVAEEYSDLMAASGVDYDFGVQLGDAIDNPDKYNEWQGTLGVFSNGVFADHDVIHVIGNHETFASSENTAKNARTIFGIPADDASGYYSFEYGNVYVAVIGYTLDRSIMQASLDWLAQDAAASEKPWKILVIHVPVYYSNAEQNDSDFYHENLPAVAEAAGITAVFSGHDHSYGRTEELNGVTYFIAGTAGEKKYACDANGFAFAETHGDGEPIAMPTQNYDALYLSLAATAKRMTLTTYNVDENGNQTVYDRTEWGVPVCTDHEYVYDRSSDLLTCSVCGTTQKAAETLYSGFARDEETGKLMYLAAGKVMTGYQFVSPDPYYFDEVGLSRDGEYTICGQTCTFQDGKYIGAADSSVQLAGWCGNNATFVLYTDGRFVIDGSGRMYDYSGYGIVPWYNYRKNIKSVDVAADITTIGNYAFRGAANLVRVTFAEGSKLKEIHAQAFHYASSIKDVVLPDGVTTLSGSAFGYCAALESVYLPDNVSSIGNTAFNQTPNVTLSVLENSYAETWAKNNGVRYTSRQLEVQKIAEGDSGSVHWIIDADGVLRFSGAGATIDYTKTAQIPWYPYRNQIVKVIVSPEVTGLGSYALRGLDKVTEVEFVAESNLGSVGHFAFYGCSALKDIPLPDSVSVIGGSAFANCPALESVYMPEAVTTLRTTTFNQSPNVTLNVAAGSYSERFAKANGVNYVVREGQPSVIDQGVSDGVNWVLFSDGELVFSGGGSTADYAKTADIPWYTYREQIIKVSVEADVKGLGNYALRGLTNLEEISFQQGSNLNRIGDLAFYGCSKLERIQMPDTVVNVGGSAFAYCPALIDVYMSESIRSLRATTFNGTTNVTLNVVSGSVSENFAKANNINYVVREASPTVVAEGLSGAVSWKVFNDGVLTLSGSGSTDSYTKTTDIPWYEYRSMISRVTVDADVTGLGSYALRGLSNVTEVSFGQGSRLQSVGNLAFYGCSALNEVWLPESVSIIGGSAFAYCTSLVRVRIPAAVKSLRTTTFNQTPNVMLIVDAGSYAESFARTNNLAFAVQE